MQRPSIADIADIDIAALCSPEAREAELARLCRACTEAGYFTLINHGIDAGLITRTYEHAARFHGLDETNPIKQRLHKSNSPARRGYSRAGEEPAYEPGTTSTCAAFDISRELPGEHSATINAWPSDSELPGFRRDITTYFTATEALGRILFEALASMLGLARDTFARHASERADSELRLLCYRPDARPVTAPRPAIANERHTGISAHTDFECFTIMTQSAPGLELMHPSGAWHTVPAQPGRLLVILGDMLERWTNGHLRATWHRVQPTPWQRLAVIVFCAVDPDVVIAPLDAFVSADNPPRYAPITQREHINDQMHAALGNAGSLPDIP